MKDRVKRNFSRAAKNYERFSEFQERAGRELLKLYTLAGSPKPVLDVGAGTGKILSGSGVVSLDISLEMTKTCRKRGNLSVCGDGELLPFKNESFNAVFSNFSLQWTDVKKAIWESERVLKKGGWLLISLPVRGSLETVFNAWKKAAGSVPLFKFPEEKEVFDSVKRKFEIVSYERLFLEKEFQSAREALKRITGIGARNPFGRAPFREARKFREILEENPKVEYRVLLLMARKP